MLRHDVKCMKNEGTMSRAALLTVVWFVFVVNLYTFRQEEPPQANVVPNASWSEGDGSRTLGELSENHNWDTSLMFMTPEAYQKEMDEYKRSHLLHGVLAVVCGIGTFIIGTILGEHWGYGLACVLVGPLAVAYTGYRTSRST